MSKSLTVITTRILILSLLPSLSLRQVARVLEEFSSAPRRVHLERALFNQRTKKDTERWRSTYDRNFAGAQEAEQRPPMMAKQCWLHK